MKIVSILVLLYSFVNSQPVCDKPANNNCVSFTISQGTGCAWMCNYCADRLGTNNYYFTDGVCTYQSGVGCVGNPSAGGSYTCCAASSSSVVE